MNVVGFVGASNSGKTTAIAALIRHFVDHGKSVGAIKHTHHPLNDENRGDTATFRVAGANPVILASEHDAVMFANAQPRHIHFDDPQDLLREFATDIVLIEGFKSVLAWPRIELSSDRRRTTAELIAILDRIWRP